MTFTSTNSGQAKRRTNFIYFAFLLLVSAVYLLFFAPSTSPLAPAFYGSDPSFFSTVGRGMLEGKLPYQDFFDMKGPYLFLIQALGHLIPGDHGIFILEVISLFCVLLLADDIIRIIFAGRVSFLVRFLCLLPSLFFLISSLAYGNYTEEWSLLPLMLCLDIFTRYIYIYIY